MFKNTKIDILLSFIVACLIFAGFFIFTSASFGLYARNGVSFQDLFFSQVVLGFIFGILVLVGAIKTPLKLIQKYALHFYIVAIVLNILVFVPHIGFGLVNGAHRWIDLRITSFQPSEMLKLATIIYYAALLPTLKENIMLAKYSLGSVALVLFFPAMLILIAQKDTGTFAVICFAVTAMVVAAGAQLRHFLIIIGVGVLMIGVLALVRPHVQERILTFFDTSRDPQGSGYQIQKSLIAIGSGGATGRGFGQSLQKFSSLPEPTTDSIFAVAAEEFGFVGGLLLVFLFLSFGVRGLQIAQKTPDLFSGLLAIGIVILIVSQSFTNISAMLGLIPLTGVPLVFVSHGGSALLFAFLETGVLLNISTQKTNYKLRNKTK